LIVTVLQPFATSTALHKSMISSFCYAFTRNFCLSTSHSSRALTAHAWGVRRWLHLQPGWHRKIGPICHALPYTGVPRLSPFVAGGGRPCGAGCTRQLLEHTTQRKNPMGRHGFCPCLGRWAGRALVPLARQHSRGGHRARAYTSVPG